ncbi:hypothetical protein LCGC14_3169140 [marine sediment metagenome]|uniref:Uncharacterized protein n=1 Tax=marine sediment metagenome TaxID=412755 RepID=A0A0F8Y3Z6_9ZZZZ
MKVRNITNDDMRRALMIVNKQYDNNVIWNRFESNGKGFRFTLKVKDSKKAGHRLSQSLTSKSNRTRMASACWHVHGDFFEALLSINEDAVIKTSGGITINKDGGNWQDRNIGSQFSPLYFSEACEC